MSAPSQEWVDGQAAALRLRERQLWLAVEVACRGTGVLPVEVLGRSRRARVAAVRAELYVLLAHTYGLSPADIGLLLGRDRTTVLYALRRRERQLEGI